MTLKSKYLTRDEWLAEDQLISSGAYKELNEALNAKVYVKYLSDKDVQAINSKKIKRDSKVVVCSFYKETSPIAHLYFQATLNPKVFDARLFRDRSIGVTELEGILQLISGGQNPFAISQRKTNKPRFFPFLRLPLDLKVVSSPFCLYQDKYATDIIERLKAVVGDSDLELALVIPDNYTIVEHSKYQVLVQMPFFNCRLKIGKSVTVLGDTAIPENKVKSIGTGFKVEGTLTVNSLSIFKGDVTCQELTLSNVIDSELDFKHVSAQHLSVYSKKRSLHIQNLNHIPEVFLGSTMFSDDVAYHLQNSEIKKLHVCDSNVKFSPNVSVAKLQISLSDTSIGSAVNINGALISKLIVKTPGNPEENGSISFLTLVVHGDVKVHHFGSKLPEHTLIYGDLTVPKDYELPNKLHCLGDIKYIDG